MSAALDGPRIPAAAGRTSQLVVFLHGYGADGNDLIELGRQWRGLMPEAAFVSPHASERAPGAPMGRQWFALSSRSPDDTRRRRGALGGRGQGAGHDRRLSRRRAPAARPRRFEAGAGRLQPRLHDGAACRSPTSRAPAAILGFSGLLVGPEHLGEATARDAHGRPPPILLIHGDQDPMIPLDAMFMATEALAGASIPTQWHLSAGIGHGIDAEGLRQGGLFLAKAFSARRR